MPTVETMIEQYKALSQEDRKRLLRELSRAEFSETLRKIAEGPEPPMPVSDEELNQIVHEVRAEVLRARGV